MSRDRQCKAKLAAALRQVEAGREVEAVENVAEKIGVSNNTIYSRKAKCGEQEVSKALRLRQLEDENGRLQKLVATLRLDTEMLKAVIARNRPELADRRTDAHWLQEQYAVSERRACGLVSMAVSSYRYVARRFDGELQEQLAQLARERPRFGYRRLYMLLRQAGEVANLKRVYRVYREAGLCLQRNKRNGCTLADAPLRQDTAAR